MKTIQKICLALLTATVLLTGCSKEDLNKKSTMDIDSELAFETVSDINRWSNGFYSYLRARTYGVYMVVTDIQSDLTSYNMYAGNRRGGPHRWDFNSSDYDIRDVWAGYYSAISNINFFLDNMDKFTPSNDSETAVFNQTKAEAYFLRAYYYYNLALRYCKDYEPSTAATDLGLPLVDHVDLSARPARATLQATFDFIKSDLTNAKTLMPAGNVKIAALNKIGHDIIDAFSARLALTMHDYDNAASISQALISSNRYPLASSETQLFNVWRNDNNAAEVMLRLTVIKGAESANTNDVYLYTSTVPTASQGPGTYHNPDFYPSQKAFDYFPNTTADWRYNIYLGNLRIVVTPTPELLAERRVVSKYLGNPDLYTNASQPNFHQAPIVFRIAEMYLINAEANYLKIASDETAAKTSINALRAKRGLGGISSTGAALFQDIKDERTRELMYEGFRLDDLKRWKESCTRGPAPTDLPSAATGNDYNGLNKPTGDDKFVWGIPANDESLNPNIEQNPGW